MSGQSLVSREFDLVVSDDPGWQAAMRAPDAGTATTCRMPTKPFQASLTASGQQRHLAWLLKRMPTRQGEQQHER